MNDSEDGVAILQGTGDDPHRVQIVDLLDCNPLPLQLSMNAVKPLDAAFDACLHPGLFQLGGDNPVGLSKECLALFPARLDRFADLFVSDGIEEPEPKIFQLTANLTHTQAVRYGRVDFERLFRDLVLTIRGQM